MLNRIIARRHRPERGWDPIPTAYAAQYAAAEWAKGADPRLMDDLDRWVGGLAGKRVLDLGGGPGHYTVAFAERGALVTWYDISRAYESIARARAVDAGLQANITFEIGYMDDAAKVLEPFDLVFNRVCWYYGHDDAAFARVIYDCIRPGGSAYVDVNPSESKRSRLRWPGRIRAGLNDHLGIKIGHPAPPRGRVERLFRRHDLARLLVDYRSPSNDRIWIQRPLAGEATAGATVPVRATRKGGPAPRPRPLRRPG